MPQALPLKMATHGHKIQSSDLLLRRGHGFKSRLIEAAGRTPYSHAGMAGFNAAGELFLIDVVEGRGGGSRLLSHVIKKDPGIWDWYKSNPGNRWPEFDRAKCEAKMWEFEGIPYGWGAIRKASLFHLWGVRLFVHCNTDDYLTAADEQLPPFCSMAVNIACMAGGVDPVRRLSVGLTEPGDLSRSLFFEFAGTLE
jgi:hypothetical protein